MSIDNSNLKQQTKKGLYWSFFNNTATQLMQFVVGIVMARLLSPEDYGITALPAVFMAVAGIFISSGFGQALVRKPEITEKDLSTSFYYSIVMGLFMYTILFFAAPLIADFYNTPVLVPLIRVTALNFLWGPLGTPQGVILQRRLDFKTPARISIINKIVSAIIGIAVAYAGYGLWALVVSGMSSSLLGLIQTWWVVKWVPKERFSRESFKYLWNYGNKMIGANLIETLYLNVAPVFIGKVYSPATLGMFNRADGYAALPVHQLMGPLQGVTFPVLSKVQNDKGLLERSYRKMMKVSSFIAFPVLFLLAALARPLVIVMVTEKWSDCILMLQILCLAKMWWPIMSLNRVALQVIGRSDLYFKLELIKRSVNVIILIVALQFGIIAFCLANLLEISVAMIFNTYYTGKHLNVGLFKQLRDVGPSYLLALTMFVIVYVSTLFISNMYLQILVGVTIGLTIYLGGSILFKFSELDDVKYMIFKKK